MAHTPGPWTVQGQAVLSDRPYPEWKQIAEVRIGNAENWSDPEGESNARLIAASPDLLAACHEAVSAITYLLSNDDDEPNYAETLSKLAAAIAKAEGRGE